MADSGTSVGKISLQIDLTQDLQEQIDSASQKITTGLQEGVGKGLNLDNLFGGIETKLKSTMDAVNKSLDAMQARMKSIVQISPGTSKTSAPGIAAAPKARASAVSVKSSTDLNVLRTQIDSVSAALETTNRMIEQQRAKLAQLKKSYTTAFDSVKQNKLDEQMLKTESRINSLTSTSDKLGFKLSDLDAQFQKVSSGASEAAAGVDNANKKLSQTDNSVKKASSSSSAFNRTINRLGLSSTMLGRILDRMLIRLLLFNTVIKAITAFSSFLNSALMTNQQFANSLAQIRSNLEIAFMPVYNAMLPAINALMAGLARVTGYIAAFMSALFGTSVAASTASARGINKAINAQKNLETQTKKTAAALKGSLAGFDEINQLDIKTPSTSPPSSGGSSGATMPAIVTPKIDTRPTSAAMREITAIAVGVRRVLATLFAPFKAAWAAQGVGVMQEIKKAFSGTASTIKHLFDVLATPPVQKFLKSIGEIILSLTKLALKVYNSFILPIVNWFIGLLPGAAKGFNPILKAVEKFINYLSGPGFKYVKTFLSTILGVVAGLKTFSIVTKVTGWIGGFINKIKDIGGVLQGVWGVMMANPVALVIGIIAGLAVTFIALYNTNEKFRKKINEIWTEIKTYFTPILQTLKGILLDLWHVVIEPLAKILKDVLVIAFKLVADIVKELWKKVLVPLGSFIADVFSKTIKGIGEIWKTWKPIIQGVIDVIMWLWNNVLKPVISFLANVFAGVFRSVFSTIGNVINDLKKVFNGLIDFIVGVLTGNWRKALRGLAEVFSGIFKGIGDVFKGIINLIISGINLLIRGLNHLKIKVPKIPGITDAFTLGFHIPLIPKLARGGIIDQPTLAMVGETRQKEAVVPLENTGFVQSIASAVTNGLLAAMKFNNSGQGSNNQSGNIILQVDGTTFARIMNPYLDKEKDRIGNRLIVKAT